MKINTHNKGYTLVETIIYIVIMVLFLAIVSYFSLKMLHYYQYITLSSRVDQTASTVLQLAAINLRSATAIDHSNSTFNSPASTLVLNQSGGGQVTFSVDDSRLVYDDTSVTAALTPEDLVVSEFRVSPLSSAVSEAVRVTVGLQFNVRDNEYEKTYSNIIILRQSYE